MSRSPFHIQLIRMEFESALALRRSALPRRLPLASLKDRERWFDNANRDAAITHQ
jgi:hypothetical protein